VKVFHIDTSTATHLDETQYADYLDLELDSITSGSVVNLGVVPATKQMIWDSYGDVPGGTLNWSGSDKIEGMTFTLQGQLLIINDNDFGLEGSAPVQAMAIKLGRNVLGNTVCHAYCAPLNLPNLNTSPKGSCSMTSIFTHEISTNFDAGAGENLAVDTSTETAYIVNTELDSVDSFDASGSSIQLLASKDLGGFQANSAAVWSVDGRVAAALEDPNGGPGQVGLYISTNGTLTEEMRFTGPFYLPDHVTWSRDCNYIVACCEAEGPAPGGVYVIDFDRQVDRVVSFDGYDSRRKIREYLRKGGSFD